MKKNLIIVIIILIIIIAPIMIFFSEYKSKQNEIKTFNLKYEKYREKTIYGTEVGSIINSIVDNNKRYEIGTDEDGNYIDDDRYCIKMKINIPIIDENYEEIEQLYDLETIVYLGVDRFIKNFNTYEFICENIEYNSTGRVKFMQFKMLI